MPWTLNSHHHTELVQSELLADNRMTTDVSALMALASKRSPVCHRGEGMARDTWRRRQYLASPKDFYNSNIAKSSGQPAYDRRRKGTMAPERGTTETRHRQQYILIALFGSRRVPRIAQRTGSRKDAHTDARAHARTYARVHVRRLFTMKISYAQIKLR